VDLRDPSGVDLALDWLFHDLMRRRQNRRLAEELELGGQERVMDFGSGSGALSRYIAHQLRDGGSLTLVDLSPKLMGVAKKKLRRFNNIEYKVGDIGKLGIPDKSYDVVHARHVLHHIAENQRLRVVQELSGKLKKNGWMFIREVSKKDHGIPLKVIQTLTAKSGLKEVSTQIEGDEYIAIYTKNQKHKK